MGSVLLAISGSGDFNLIAFISGFQMKRLMHSLAGIAPTTIGGILPRTSSTWSGVMLVTNDVTIPVGHTLTIASNTVVLVNGASSGTTAPRILVNGTINSLGEEGYPVTITVTELVAP